MKCDSAQRIWLLLPQTWQLGPSFHLSTLGLLVASEVAPEQKEKAKHMVLMARESETESKASMLQRSGEASCEEGWLLKTGVGHQGLEQGQ